MMSQHAVPSVSGAPKANVGAKSELIDARDFDVETSGFQVKVAVPFCLDVEGGESQRLFFRGTTIGTMPC